MAQSQIIIDRIKRNHPEIEVELVTMKTTGDLILDQTLDKIGGKGLFVKELDDALLLGEVDLVVHSFKDLPMEEKSDFPILAIFEREDPRDVLVLPQGQNEIDFSKAIGTSSKRRAIQLRALYPEAKTAPIRGNILTRLEKLDRGEFSALVLAYAGLKRVGLEKRVSRIFDSSEMIPAACQGALAIQGSKNFDPRFLVGLDHRESRIVSTAERAFVRFLDGGCTSPVAAYGQLDEEILTLTGFDVLPSGETIVMTLTGKGQDAEMLGCELARKVEKEKC